MSSRGVNKVILVGNLGGDLKCVIFPMAVQLPPLSLATSRAGVISSPVNRKK